MMLIEGVWLEVEQWMLPVWLVEEVGGKDLSL